jgi:hypothetical protein
MLMVAGVWITTPACAAQTYGYGYPTRNGGYGRDIERRAYDTGYREGLRAGERDGRDGRSFSYNRHDDWRDADDGYHREYGNRDFYRRTFRSGFEAGYSDSYNRYANYGRYPRGGSYPTYPSYPSPSYPSYPTDRGGVAVPRGSIAVDNGYRDGFEAGRDDARDRDRFDYRRAKRYREGDRGYDNRYGSRDAYKQDYRAGFQRGYEDGYRGSARR